MFFDQFVQAFNWHQGGLNGMLNSYQSFQPKENGMERVSGRADTLKPSFQS